MEFQKYFPKFRKKQKKKNAVQYEPKLALQHLQTGNAPISLHIRAVSL